MVIPALLIRQATEDVAASGLRDAPVRPLRSAPAPPGLRALLQRRVLRRHVRELLDELVLEDAEWHVAREASADALDRWVSAEPPEQATAFAAYRAALDREEAAARELRRAKER
jgi:hypothetical protein